MIIYPDIDYPYYDSKKDKEESEDEIDDSDRPDILEPDNPVEDDRIDPKYANAGHQCSFKLSRQHGYLSENKMLMWDSSKIENSHDIKGISNDFIDNLKYMSVCHFDATKNEAYENCAIQSPFLQFSKQNSKCEPYGCPRGFVRQGEDCVMDVANLKTFKWTDARYCEERSYDWYTISNYHTGNGFKRYLSQSKSDPDYHELNMESCLTPCNIGEIPFVRRKTEVNNPDNKACLVKRTAFDSIYGNTIDYSPIAGITLLGTTYSRFKKIYISEVNKYLNIPNEPGVISSAAHASKYVRDVELYKKQTSDAHIRVLYEDVVKAANNFIDHLLLQLPANQSPDKFYAEMKDLEMKQALSIQTKEKIINAYDIAKLFKRYYVQNIIFASNNPKNYIINLGDYDYEENELFEELNKYNPRLNAKGKFRNMYFNIFHYFVIRAFGKEETYEEMNQYVKSNYATANYHSQEIVPLESLNFDDIKVEINDSKEPIIDPTENPNGPVSKIQTKPVSQPSIRKGDTSSGTGTGTGPNGGKEKAERGKSLFDFDYNIFTMNISNITFMDYTSEQTNPFFDNIYLEMIPNIIIAGFIIFLIFISLYIIMLILFRGKIISMFIKILDYIGRIIVWLITFISYAAYYLMGYLGMISTEANIYVPHPSTTKSAAKATGPKSNYTKNPSETNKNQEVAKKNNEKKPTLSIEGSKAPQIEAAKQLQALPAPPAPLAPSASQFPLALPALPAPPAPPAPLAPSASPVKPVKPVSNAKKVK